MEGKEWIWDSGVLKEKALNEIKRNIKSSSSKKLTETKLKAFNKFLSNL